MRYQGGLVAKLAATKSIFYYFKLSLFILMIGIFLLPNGMPMLTLAAQATSTITTDKIINSINLERKKISLPSLKYSSILQQAAEQKAKNIFASQNFSHNFADKKFSTWIKEAGYNYAIVGENLAINFSNGHALFNAWLASPTHKKNILYPDYQDIGLAITSGHWFEEETTLVVAIFGMPAIARTIAPNVPLGIAAPLSKNSQPLLISNLAESYLNHIQNPELSLPLNTSKVNLDMEILQNKTAIINYLNMTVKVMAIFTTLMLMLIVCIYYLNYFFEFFKKLKFLDSQP